MKLKIIAVLFGLTPFLQFFARGWIYFLITLPIYIVAYYFFKKKEHINFVIYSAVLIVAQAAAYIIGISFFLVFAYILMVAFLMFIASKDSLRYNELKNFLKENKMNPENYIFEMCFYGQGEIGNLEEVRNLQSVILAMGKNGIAINMQIDKKQINRFISKKEIVDFGVFKFEKDQEFYYARIRDMFWPQRKIINLHKPKLETYGFAVRLDDETLSFYEEANIIFKISDTMEKYR